MRISTKLFIASLLLINVVAFAAIKDKTQQTVADRLKPVGEVVFKDDLAKQQVASASVGVTLTAEQIYNKHCVVCHAAGVAGAPKLHNKVDWAPRVAAGMDDMLSKAVKGFKAMPPKGTCMECNDDQIKDAIKYMLP